MAYRTLTEEIRETRNKEIQAIILGEEQREKARDYGEFVEKQKEYHKSKITFELRKSGEVEIRKETF